MKIICSHADLLKGIQSVQSIISTRASLPILANVLLETHKDKLKCAATDLEVGIKTDIPTEVVKEGSITLPAKILFDIVRELPDQDVHIDVTPEYKVVLTCGKIVYKLMGMPKDEFPIIPDFKDENSFELEKGVLKNMIQKTIFAISSDETRYVLTGVLFQTSAGNAEMVSTDGRRLAYINGGKVGKTLKNKLDVIVPAKALREVSRLLGDGSGSEQKVAVEIAENQIAFKIDSTVLVSRLVEGKFPNYKQVIPKDHSIQLELQTEDFFNAIKRIALLAPEKAESIKIDLGKEKMTISTIAQGVGEAQQEIDINYKGNAIETAYNPRYLLDVLKNLETKEIMIEMSNPMSPGVIKAKEKSDYLYVIMPMRL